MPNRSGPKILQVCAVDFTAKHFLLPLMRAQVKWGFDVELACRPGDVSAEIIQEGFNLRPVGFSRGLNPVAHAKAYRALHKVVARGSYTVVHLHTPAASLIGRPAARRAGAPIVLYTAHGFYFHEAMSPWLRRAHILLERSAGRYDDFLLTVSREDAGTAVAEGIVAPSRVRAIGNGVDLESFRPRALDQNAIWGVRERLGLGAGDGPVVCISGRLVREKGFLDLIEAWPRVLEGLPKAKLLVVGGALRSDRRNIETELRAEIARRGLGESVRMLGYRSDVVELLCVSDLFVLPSWREGMPVSIMEAMACGLPVVATDIRGSREEVVHGRTGLLVPVRDPARLAAAILEILNDPRKRKEMGELGRERAERLFDEREFIARQREVYQQLFGEKGLRWPED